MPSDSTSPDPNDASPADESSEATSNTAPTPVETTTCPNCSRRFVGTYCPNCGQKNRPASVLDLVSGFLREVVDLDAGFWPTLKGLILRPGLTLRRYLQGARRSYMHPGRYLLTAIVVATLATQGLGRMGLTTGSSSVGDAPEEAAGPDSVSATANPAPSDTTSSFGYRLGYTLGEIGEAIGVKEDSDPLGERRGSDTTSEGGEGLNVLSALDNHYVRMIYAVTMALFLGLVYRRMFPDVLPRVAPAFALAMFVMGHVILLTHVLNTSVTVFQYVRTGGSVEPTPIGLLLVLLLLGNGIAAGACFGPSESTWRAGLKGGIAAMIALIDTMALLIFVLFAYKGGQSFWVPGVIPPDHPLFWFLAVTLVLGVLILFLPHLGLILYRRFRPKGAGTP